MAGDVSDLVFISGSRKIKLSVQRPLVQLVIRSSFDIVYSSLVSINAFPDGAISVRFVKEALLRAALRYTPGTAPIYRRLKNDHDYFCRILPLVSPMDVHDHSTDTIHSHVFGFPLSDPRSKNIAVQLLH